MRGGCCNEEKVEWKYGQVEGKTEGIKLAANSLYAHSAYSKITAIIFISAFSLHSVKAILNSSHTLLAPVNLLLARGQPISSWGAAINDVYKEPCGLRWVFRWGCASALSAILLNTARTHTPVLSRCLSICTKCHNITFLMGTSTNDAHSQQGLTNTPKIPPKICKYRTEGITHIPSTTQQKLHGESCLKKSGRGTGLVPGHFSFIKILFFAYY